MSLSLSLLTFAEASRRVAARVVEPARTAAAVATDFFLKETAYTCLFHKSIQRQLYKNTAQHGENTGHRQTRVALPMQLWRHSAILTLLYHNMHI